MTVKNDEELLTAEAVDTVDSPDDAEASADPTTVAATPPDRPAGPLRRVLQGAARFWVVIVLITALAVTGGVTAWLYVNQYRPDQATGSAAADSALKPAVPAIRGVAAKARFCRRPKFATASTTTAMARSTNPVRVAR